MNLEIIIFIIIPGIFLMTTVIAFRKTSNLWAGFGLTFFLFPVFAVIGLLLIYGYTEVNKAYWDHRVKELCERDGGVTVYKTVELTKEEYQRFAGSNGSISVPSETASYADRYLYLSTYDKKIIHQSNPTVYRWESVVYRKTDGEMLGRVISYQRGGGDFPTIIGHPSGFNCKGIDIKLNVEKQIFSIKEE